MKVSPVLASAAMRLALALVLGLAGPGGEAVAQDTAAPPQVVVRVCSGCHGLDGAFGWAQIPRLAAQLPGYLESQMAAFRRAEPPPRAQVPAWLVAPAATPPGARAEGQALTFMVGIARSVSPADAAAAAAWYASRPPAPGIPSDDAELWTRGRTLFQNGVPSKGVPACSDCHGAQAQGMADFPRLAGQRADYVQRQLQALKDGRRSDAPAMQIQAKNLDAEQMRALAAYVQSL